jgi:hypothetical protein
MADRAAERDDKDTKVEDEMIGADEDGNDEVTFKIFKMRQCAHIISRKKSLR